MGHPWVNTTRASSGPLQYQGLNGRPTHKLWAGHYMWVSGARHGQKKILREASLEGESNVVLLLFGRGWTLNSVTKRRWSAEDTSRVPSAGIKSVLSKYVNVEGDDLTRHQPSIMLPGCNLLAEASATLGCMCFSLRVCWREETCR